MNQDGADTSDTNTWAVPGVVEARSHLALEGIISNGMADPNRLFGTGIRGRDGALLAASHSL